MLRMRFQYALICCVVAGCGKTTPPKLADAFATPQVVFHVAQSAANERDFVRVLQCHSPDTIEELTATTIFSAAMMRRLADDLFGRGDNRYVDAKHRVDAILEKHAVDLSKIQPKDLQPHSPNLAPFFELAKSVADQQRFLAELLAELEAAKGTETTGFQDQLRGELVDVQIRGDIAEGTIKRREAGALESKSISFKKSQDGWRIHMSGAPQPPSSTTNRVCEMVAELLNVDRAKLNRRTSLGELGADDLDFVELIMEFEEEFEITIPDDAAEAMLGSKDRQQGMNNVTLEKFAALIDERKELPRQSNSAPRSKPPSHSPQVKVFLNPLYMLLTAAEKKKGEPLTQSEVLAVRDNAAFAMLSPEQAEKFHAAMKSQFPIPQLNPDRIFEEWQEIRSQAGPEN